MPYPDEPPASDDELMEKCSPTDIEQYYSTARPARAGW
jgi:hypothetical protein